MKDINVPQIAIAQTIQQSIAQALKQLNLNVAEQEIHLEHPNLEQHGEYTTNIAMQLVKQTDTFNNPRELAQAIVDHISSDSYDKIEVAGPGFINFYLSNSTLINELQLIKDRGGEYGKNDWGKGKTWLLEHTSPNPNKAMHLGHLRNNVTGMAIGNLWEALNIHVIRDCIDNDRGIAIAKLMWGYLKFAHKEDNQSADINYWHDHQDEWQTPEELNIRPDLFVDQLYVKGSEDFKNPEVEKHVRQFVVDWEAHDQKTWDLWKKVLDYSHEGQNLTLQRLGNKWDKVWHEHEHYQEGKDLVQKGLEIGILRQLEDGAILTNLEKDFNLTDTIVQKADGTSLYITQDLALTRKKKEAFHPDKMHWVIGPEQALAMKQVFAVCDQLGIIEYENCHHIPYGYMSIKGQGKMSSREGNVVYIDDLINQVKSRIQETSPSDQDPEDIAIGAVKYSILKTGRMTNTAFDIEESISIQGNSGPYLQYTHARCHSVITKSENIQPSDKSSVAPNPEELTILKHLYRFPEVVTQAALEYAPNHICTYLFELAQRYNTFYNKHSVLNATDDQTKYFRVQLTEAVQQIIKNGLNMLGIKALDKM